MITNQPITTEKSFGEQSLLFGIFSKTMLPGFVLALVPYTIVNDMTHDKFKAAPAGGFVLISYWIYVGNDRKKAWRSLGRHVPKHTPYIGSAENKSVLGAYGYAKDDTR
jgi:hypothetical protein